MTCNVDRPRRYFALHYLLFRFLGLGWWHHPDQNNTNNFPGVYIFWAIFSEIALVAAFICLETIDPFIGDKDRDRFMISLSFVITHDLTLIKIFLFYYKNQDIQDVVRTLEIDLYEFYQDNKRNSRTVKITKVISSLFVFFGWMTIANGNVYGIIQDIKWKTEVAQINDTSLILSRTLPQPIYIPWNYQSEKTFIFTFALENVGLLWTGHILLTIDTFIGSMIFHMSNQFIILQQAFETAYDRAMNSLIENIPDLDETEEDDESDKNEKLVRRFYSEEQVQEALELSLKNCIHQHQVLIGCVTKFANIYTFGFLTQMISSMTVICVVMVQISQDASSFKSLRLLTSLAFFAAMIIQLAIQCFTGNELTIQAGKVSDAVMRSRWERLPPRLRRMLVLVMMRAQKPLQLTAAGFSTMNNDCFVAIMKAAYSYYAVLSQKQV